LRAGTSFLGSELGEEEYLHARKMESKGDGLYLFSAKNPMCAYSLAMYNPGNKWLYFYFQYFNSVPDIDITTEVLEKLRHVWHHQLISAVTLTGNQEHHRVNRGASSDR